VLHEFADHLLLLNSKCHPIVYLKINFMKLFSYSVFCLAMQMNLAECTDLQTNGNPLQMIQRYIIEVHIHELQVTHRK
jgi:hypothetical protein